MRCQHAGSEHSYEGAKAVQLLANFRRPPNATSSGNPNNASVDGSGVFVNDWTNTGVPGAVGASERML
jgi:hypothetical protein